MFLFLLLSLCTVSCSLFSGSIKASTESRKENDAKIRSEGFLIKSVKIVKSFDSDMVRENAEYALAILVPTSITASGKTMGADIVLKEESFIKGFRQLNTVSLEMIILDINGNIVKRILISEETENTLSSYSYLYKILKKGVSKTGL